MVVQPLLAIRIISIIIALVLFWIVSEEKRAVKKHKAESFVSLMTTWVLFFIGVKVLTKWELLLDHPIALLAYPSGTLEFYLATLFTLILKLRQYHSYQDYLYEYVQLTAYSLLSFSILTRLFLQEGGWLELLVTFLFFILITIYRAPLQAIILISFLSGIAGFLFETPAIMGYRMDTWFYLVISLVGILFLKFDKRRVTS
ncbi:hypothetical protein [Halobacillus seohaensis]|uniref:Uncharacterized protein n=1 Tax=Halobacillus seohaensis TaxID=447421 RepID=A0ABW2EN76_9BACI